MRNYIALFSYSAGLAVTFFEIGGIVGSFLTGIMTDKWMQKVNISTGRLHALQSAVAVVLTSLNYRLLARRKIPWIVHSFQVQ